jgi:large subunit ribosomal protein L28
MIESIEITCDIGPLVLGSYPASIISERRNEETTMAVKCDICGKGPMSGNLVSHSNIKTRRVSKPNLQRIKVYVDGTPKRMRICTRCLRSDKVVKRTK